MTTWRITQLKNDSSFPVITSLTFYVFSKCNKLYNGEIIKHNALPYIPAISPCHLCSSPFLIKKMCKIWAFWQTAFSHSMTLFPFKKQAKENSSQDFCRLYTHSKTSSEMWYNIKFDCINIRVRLTFKTPLNIRI